MWLKGQQNSYFCDVTSAWWDWYHSHFWLLNLVCVCLKHNTLVGVHVPVSAQKPKEDTRCLPAVSFSALFLGSRISHWTWKWAGGQKARWSSCFCLPQCRGYRCACGHALLFQWLLEVWTQILMLPQSTFLATSHLPIISHPLAFHNDYVLTLTTDDGRVLRFSLPFH